MTISVIAIDPSSKAPNVDSGAFRLFCIVRLPSRVDDGPWNRGGDRAQRRSDFPACSAVPTMWFRIQGKLNECLRNLVNDGRRGKRYSSGFASVAAIAKLCTCRLLASCNLSFRPCGGISFVRSCGKPGTIAVASNEERFLGFARNDRVSWWQEMRVTMDSPPGRERRGLTAHSPYGTESDSLDVRRGPRGAFLGTLSDLPTSRTLSHFENRLLEGESGLLTLIGKAQRDHGFQGW
jgi:hypothetical protein